MPRMVWDVVGTARPVQGEVREEGSFVMSASRNLVFAVGSYEEFLRVLSIVSDSERERGSCVGIMSGTACMCGLAE